jgi:hypothetical protein
MNFVLALTSEDLCQLIIIESKTIATGCTVDAMMVQWIFVLELNRALAEGRLLIRLGSGRYATHFCFINFTNILSDKFYY